MFLMLSYWICKEEGRKGKQCPSDWSCPNKGGVRMAGSIMKGASSIKGHHKQALITLKLNLKLMNERMKV